MTELQVWAVIILGFINVMAILSTVDKWGKK